MLHSIDWQTLLIAGAFIAGIMLGPFDVLRMLERRWKQRQRDRIARGEDVHPKQRSHDEFWE